MNLNQTTFSINSRFPMTSFVNLFQNLRTMRSFVWTLLALLTFGPPVPAFAGKLTATSTSLSQSASTIIATGSVTLTASVAPFAATGTVTFKSGTTTLGTALVSSGTATYVAAFPTAGSFSLTAVYGGSATYA